MLDRVYTISGYITGILLLICILQYYSSSNSQKSLEWTKIQTIEALQKELKIDKSLHKPVLIDFSAKWCADCQAMDKVYNNADLDRFDVIKVDISVYTTDIQLIEKQYGIIGSPTAILLDSNGNVQQKLVGLISIKDMEKYLSLVH